MLIKDIMTKDVEVVSPDTPLTEVASRMQQRDCGAILVAENDRLVGMITDRDIAIRCVAELHDPKGTTAAKVMSPQILYCMETDEADVVARNMSENKVRRLPVLNADKRLVGIVTLGDLASHTNYKLCGETLGNICRDKREITGPMMETTPAAPAT
jgi:CBS domain-containing protein